MVYKEIAQHFPGTPVFAHYTSARQWYAPLDLAKINNSEIERVTKMDKKKKYRLSFLTQYRKGELKREKCFSVKKLKDVRLDLSPLKPLFHQTYLPPTNHNVGCILFCNPTPNGGY